MPSLLRVFFILLCSLSLWRIDLSAQIVASVDYLRQQQDSSAAVINIRWSTTDEQKWHNENDERLDILGLKTNITSSSMANSAFKTTNYAFDFQDVALVEFVFNLNSLAPGEELLLIDTVKGEILFNLIGQSRSTFLTPAFDPSAVSLVWKCSERSMYQSDFTISNFYVQRIDPRQILDIGFGTALACHPNAACKQDSLMRLISSTAVRIRLVMEEGIGWCSGSFVNNTRNDKTPFLLTAYHCQFDFTPLYAMWRFDFEYKSEACPNPITEPLVLSLTGCELISSGQASDFLLVRLDDQIPVNQDVTFAGWDHDEAAIPDVSYLVHHPNADIRKLSTSVNKAAIHPNQITWTEGYTTPAFHHFRLKFTEGGHEHGSSGGPLFNQNGYLVGQLHGGTAGCDTTKNAYAGRFAKSWNLGPTPQDRLKDWLDPDQTGALRIPSIKNIDASDIVTIRGTIVDPSGSVIRNTTIKVSGSVQATLMTNDDGVFEIKDVNRNGLYNIKPEKKENPTNGLSALDLVAIQKHLLGKDTFDFPWQYIAADATNNTAITVGDILIILKLLLGKIQILPTSSSWRFDPPEVALGALPPGDQEMIQITGIKIGDVNGTADPDQ